MRKDSKRARPASAVFHAVTHVWGREYLETFLTVCVPNQLAAGNVPALPPGSRYRILTRGIHVAEVEAHAMVQAVARLVPVDVVAVPELEHIGTAHGYELHTACHRRALSDAFESDAAVIFLSSDFVLSSNAMAAIVGRHRRGCRALMTTGLRLDKASFLASLRHSGAQLDELAPRDLVRHGLPHLHAHTRSMYTNARLFSTFPVAAYWQVGGDGLLARCLHLHPLMIDPVGTVLPTATVDGRYVARACPDFAQVHVVTDSDELHMFELTDAERIVVDASRSTKTGLAIWRTAVVASRCDDFQIEYWKRPIRIHGSEIDARWDSAAAEADVFARAVIWRCRPFGIPAPGLVRFVERWRQFVDRYLRSWRRRMPRIRMKSLVRPVRLVRSRVGGTLRRTTRQLFRHMGAHSR